MNYSNPKLHLSIDLQPEYKLVKRSAPKSNGRFVSYYRAGGYFPIDRVFSHAVMNPDNVDEIFKDDGKLMIVENLGRVDRVVFPKELKRLITDNGILFKSNFKAQKDIDTRLKRRIAGI